MGVCVSFEAVAWALDAPVGGTQKVLLIGIASHADRYGDNAWPSIDTLVKYAHADIRTVQRALNELVRMGLLFRRVNEGGSRQTAAHMRPNLYRLNMAFGYNDESKSVAKNSEKHPPASTPPPGADATPPPGVHATTPPASTPPHPPASTPPEPSIEPSLNHPYTHTTGEGAGGREVSGVVFPGNFSPVFCGTQAGEVCKAIKAQGVADTSPGHPKLLALLEAGAGVGEFIGAAAEAAERGKGFAYVLGMVANRRKEAAALAAGGLPQGGRVAKPRSAEPAWRAEQRSRMQQACPRIAVKEPAAHGQFDPSTAIDVEARHVPPNALG